MHQLLQPTDWAPAKGYANGLVTTLQAGSQIITVGGQIGWNAQQQFESDDFIVQTKQALLNVRAILEAAGVAPEHMTRMTWYITDCDEYNARLRELGGVYREVMGKNFPAMSCVGVSRLVEKRAKVEIEVTAVKP
ncbi:MAG: RidA family protein [Burkholderiales bacterium]|nr:MAG: RidA family protein [Burkholderiales bacterium]